MAKNHIYTPSVVTPSGSVSGSAQTFSGDKHVELDVNLEVVSNQLIALVLDVSQIKSIIIIATKAMVLEFNDSTTGEPTLTLVAGIPYIWNNTMQSTLLLTADVTALYATSAVAGNNLKLSAIVDATV